MERASIGGFPLRVEPKDGDGSEIAGIVEEDFPGQGTAREMEQNIAKFKKQERSWCS